MDFSKYENKLPYPDKARVALKKYYEQLQLYCKEEVRLHNLFRQDLEAEAGTSNNPKKDLLFEKAWEFGHSAGFSEIASYYFDLAELVK